MRLGDGTDESHARMQAALDAEWPWLDELFDARPTPALVEQGSPSTRPLRAGRARRVAAVVAEATLELPQVAPAVGGGRRGLHTEHLGYLLAEMQHLARSHPGATW